MPKRTKKAVVKDEDNEDVAEAKPARKRQKKEPAEDAKPAKTPKGKKEKEEENGDGDTPALKKVPSVDVSGMDFTSDSKTEDGRTWNVKIASWNINGIRAWLSKDGTSYIKAEAPDVMCLQETKCDTSKIPADCKIEGYTAHWLSGDKEGYSGVGMYTKTKPINVTYGIDVSKHDNEGRVITAEFEKYYVVTAYVPNSGRGLPRLNYRTKEWDVDFIKYLKDLDAKKPVIMCGDLNVAHLDIDLKNPKTNKKNAGFTPQEREGFTNLLNEGFVDTYRKLYPDKEAAYTFWAYFMNNRAKDCGWRLDYFVVSERLTKDLCDSVIRKHVMGSDHCPVVLYMNL
ncbi:exodeoxyribonuclease [Patella vulgata]|uniref:exodeoxyribonuclease n=1 Tax=Patella vulgata TaxID=6465 RepID=UPI0024A81E51|nr:exodeoxyribonuclease [Patella vulgata]